MPTESCTLSDSKPEDPQIEDDTLIKRKTNDPELQEFVAKNSPKR